MSLERPNVKPGNASMTTVKPARTDWQTERERIDLAAVATSLLGPVPGRRGERGL